MIHIIQCLCPDRHCIYGMAYDSADFKPGEAMIGFREMVQAAFDKKLFNPWCGICGSTVLSYEDCSTRARERRQGMLYHVTTAYFCIGVLVEDGEVIATAPILKWAIGKKWADVAAWIKKKDGTAEIVEE
jgi:hypothetical protein